MKKTLTLALGVFLAAGAANAATITANNLTSEVIPAPGAINDDSPGNNTTVKAFEEAVGIILADDLANTLPTIDAGTAVDSHMLFLNRVDTDTTRARVNYSFTFSEAIVGLIIGTTNINNTSFGTNGFPLLGAPGTTYSNLNGFEGRGDTWTITGGNTISGRMTVTQPGDWIRVITESPAPVPLPAAGWMLLAGVGGLAAARRGRKSA